MNKLSEKWFGNAFMWWYLKRNKKDSFDNKIPLTLNGGRLVDYKRKHERQFTSSNSDFVHTSYVIGTQQLPYMHFNINLYINIISYSLFYYFLCNKRCHRRKLV